MRASAVVVALPVVLATSAARADNFLDLEGGISIPVSDSDWTDTAESSPKLAVHIGDIPKTVGGMLAVDWTPVNTDFGQQYPDNADVSAHRFRILVGPAFQSALKAKLFLTGRMGVGIDIAHANVKFSAGPLSTENSDTDIGFGFEMAAGLWARVGSIAIGGEVALPVSHHDHTADQGGIDFKYTSVDVDVLFGVRLLTD